MDFAGWYSTLYGAFAAGFLIAGICFLRMWRMERQPLIVFIAAAFVMLALNYGLLGALLGDETSDGWIYLIRLGAFALILIGILATNLQRRRKS
jgi:hypothetical protein